VEYGGLYGIWIENQTESTVIYFVWLS